MESFALMLVKMVLNRIRRYLGFKLPISRRKPLQSRINKISITPEGLVLKKAGDVFFRHGHRYDPYFLLKREAIFLKKMNGVHVPRLLEVGDRWLVMEHCGDELSANNLPINWRDQIDSIVSALDEAQIVHRDIKQGNLLVRDGKLFLIDFGWAIWKEEEPYLSPRELYRDFLGRHCIPHNQIYDNRSALLWVVSECKPSIYEP
jgi:serine/threonine protein kinase